MSRSISGHDVSAYLHRLDVLIGTATATAGLAAEDEDWGGFARGLITAEALRVARVLAAEHFGPVLRGEEGA